MEHYFCASDWPFGPCDEQMCEQQRSEKFDHSSLIAFRIKPDPIITSFSVPGCTIQVCVRISPFPSQITQLSAQCLRSFSATWSRIRRSSWSNVTVVTTSLYKIQNPIQKFFLNHANDNNLVQYRLFQY